MTGAKILNDDVINNYSAPLLSLEITFVICPSKLSPRIFPEYIATPFKSVINTLKEYTIGYHLFRIIFGIIKSEFTKTADV